MVLASLASSSPSSPSPLPSLHQTPPPQPSAASFPSPLPYSLSPPLLSRRLSGNSSLKLPRRTALATVLLAASSPFLHLPASLFARAEEKFSGDDPEQDEQRVVRLFQESSPSVVFIKYLELQANAGQRETASVSEQGEDAEDLSGAKIEGTGSGFVWDKAGHIVTNYHVVAKLASDRSGLQRCKVYFEDSNGKTFSKEGKLIGFDPAYDLAVLKVDVDEDKLRPALIGSSRDLRVGQSCYAIGNPYGYEHTLTTGVVSGLGREIPSPNGRPIRGAIQTDADINAGNSGGPLINSHGHVIGVNTSTFTRRGTGISSGVNFAIPIDVVVGTVPYLIVYGTSVSNRF